MTMMVMRMVVKMMMMMSVMVIVMVVVVVVVGDGRLSDADCWALQLNCNTECT